MVTSGNKGLDTVDAKVYGTDMRKAFVPRHSTMVLARQIRNLDGIERVEIVPGYGRPTLMRVYTQSNSLEKVYTDFTLTEARQWLASEVA